MQGLKSALLQEQTHLESIANKARAGLESVPEGHLRISKDKNKPRYYQCKEDGREIYIPRENVEFPMKLAQKSYDQKVLKQAERRLKQIRMMTKDYSDDELEQLYTSMNRERQRLVEPVEPIWEKKMEQWYGEEYQGKEFQEGVPVILTERGERVRSKSEKILADYFYRRNILYKYEKPLYLQGYGTVYPDFTFLSKKRGQEIFWEHEGMMDKPEYARSAVRKLETYQKNKIFLGERLIVTFETEKTVLNFNMIEELVEKYLVC